MSRAGRRQSPRLDSWKFFPSEAAFLLLAAAVSPDLHRFPVATAIMEKLRSRLAGKATVLRDEQPQSIPRENVVPGDVVVLGLVKKVTQRNPGKKIFHSLLKRALRRRPYHRRGAA